MNGSFFPINSNNQLLWGKAGQSLQLLWEKQQKPAYVYDLSGIEARYLDLQHLLPSTQIYYAMKANSHCEVIRRLHQMGAGIDVVSQGEIRRALECGVPPQQIVYSGVGKTEAEMTLALQVGIHQFNVESIPELRRLRDLCGRLKRHAEIALRLNPNIDIQTHPYIATGLRENKFGIELAALPEALALVRGPGNPLRLVGVSLHLGSQMIEFAGFRESLQLLKKVFLELRREFSSVERFDFGGGLGIIYENEDLISEKKILSDYAAIVATELGDLKCQLQTEPGRWLVAHSGVLLTQIQYVKPTSERTFLIVDSGMNHLLRPALYGAYHRILPVLTADDRQLMKYDIVGPICESSDFFARDRVLRECRPGEILAVLDVGAYGASMASTYNLQAPADEVLI